MQAMHALRAESELTWASNYSRFLLDWLLLSRRVALQVQLLQVEYVHQTAL